MTASALLVSIAQESPRRENRISRAPRTRLLRFVARRPFILIFSLVALSLAMVRMACWHVPAVSNMDEFSLLLQADTFRHLRLTNPTHPLWQSFETLHVIQVPSYASKFPPAPAVMLALGITIFGNPIWGSWLSTVAAVLAVFWMFRGWLPRRWAFIGAVFALMNPVVLSWARTYMACGIGLAGAALALGAACRVRRRGGWMNGAILALGCGIMANTRPFEGFVLALLIAAWLTPRKRLRFLKSAAWGALPVGLAILAFMVYYNWRVTGNALELPYVAHQKQYDMVPSFFFQNARAAPQYRDRHIWQFHRWELACWEAEHERKLWHVLYLKLTLLALFLKSPAGLLMLFLPLAWRKSHVKWAAIGTALMTAAMLSGIWLNLNYTSPFSVLFLIMQVGCLCYVVHDAATHSSRRRAKMLRAATVTVIALSLLFAVPLARRINLNDSPYGEIREQIIQFLSSDPQPSVVFVRCVEARHFIFEEWVYNTADIDTQKVIWALDKSPEQNAAVIRYYAGRKFWLFLADDRSLIPYEMQPH